MTCEKCSISELKIRKKELVKRFNELAKGATNTVSVELNYSWEWAQGDDCNFWLNVNDDENSVAIDNFAAKLRAEIDQKIKDLIDDVKKFKADGGEWELW